MQHGPECKSIMKGSFAFNLHFDISFGPTATYCKHHHKAPWALVQNCADKIMEGSLTFMVGLQTLANHCSPWPLIYPRPIIEKFWRFSNLSHILALSHESGSSKDNIVPSTCSHGKRCSLKLNERIADLYWDHGQETTLPHIKPLIGWGFHSMEKNIAPSRSTICTKLGLRLINLL
jgi:hypothetical protein